MAESIESQLQFSESYFDQSANVSWMKGWVIPGEKPSGS